MHRVLKHLFYGPWRTTRAFSRPTMQAIEDAIAASETTHRGEIRFAVEETLDLAALCRGVSARQRAIDVFSQLRVWDTEENTGILIYILLAERRVEIVADRGIHRRVGDEAWQRLCTIMEEAFRRGDFCAGSLAGIQAAGELLTTHFPAIGANPDELPNAPVQL